MRLSFPHPLLVCNGHVESLTIEHDCSPMPVFLLIVPQDVERYKHKRKAVECLRQCNGASWQTPIDSELGKTPVDSDGSKGGLPTRRDSRPPRCECVPRWQTWFRWRFRMFSYTVWCVIAGGEMCSESCARPSAVRSRGRQGEKPCVSCLRRFELSAQVRQHNSYASYSEGYTEGLPMGIAAETFCGAFRTAVAVFAHRMCTDWCKSPSQPHTKPLSSPNCRQSRMRKLCIHCHWN